MKYALILIEKGSDNSTDIHELVRLHYINNEISYSPTRLTSLEALEEALKDIKRDGLNIWFYLNGEFTYNHVQDIWTWRRKTASTGETSNTIIGTHYSD